VSQIIPEFPKKLQMASLVSLFSPWKWTSLNSQALEFHAMPTEAAEAEEPLLAADEDANTDSGKSGRPWTLGKVIAITLFAIGVLGISLMLLWLLFAVVNGNGAAAPGPDIYMQPEVMSFFVLYVWRIIRRPRRFAVETLTTSSSGDSYTDSGFNINSAAPTLSQALGFPPLDPWPNCLNQTLLGEIPMTSSNGPVWPEFLAAKYNATLTLAYDFARSGGTIKQSLVEQIKEVYTPKYSSLYTTGPAEGVRWMSESSIFAIFMGINDLHQCCANMFGSMDPKYQTFEECIHPRFELYFNDLVAHLYDTGARNFLFINLPPVQRAPQTLGWPLPVQANYTHGVQSFNALLPAWVTNFTKQHDGVRSTLYDSHALYKKILDNPKDYGFRDAGCYSCICVTEYDPECVWSNGFHPNWQVHEMMAKEMLPKLAEVGWPLNERSI
jgi:hypothetical protein